MEIWWFLKLRKTNKSDTIYLLRNFLESIIIKECDKFWVIFLIICWTIFHILKRTFAIDIKIRWFLKMWENKRKGYSSYINNFSYINCYQGEKLLIRFRHTISLIGGFLRCGSFGDWEEKKVVITHRRGLTHHWKVELEEEIWDLKKKGVILRDKGEVLRG